MAMNFEPHECAIFVQSTNIGMDENKAIHSICKKGSPVSLLGWAR